MEGIQGIESGRFWRVFFIHDKINSFYFVELKKVEDFERLR